MKTFIANAAVYSIMFLMGVVILMFVSAVCGIFITESLVWSLAAVKAGAPILIGSILVTAILVLALKHTTK
jgi:hypothetical protein